VENIRDMLNAGADKGQPQHGRDSQSRLNQGVRLSLWEPMYRCRDRR
jgi:hypothetical protein